MNAPLPTAQADPAHQLERSTRQQQLVAAVAPLPLAVALPETEAQVAAVLAACHRLGVPVVARGAGTGLSGGAMPHPLGLTLSLAKFNRIVQVDVHARTATVQCGVRNLAISEAVARHGLYYAPDPSSQIACTIGGNVAENSGGVHCLKYGLTLHNVLRVRGYTAEGEPVEFGSEALDVPGLDLLPLVVGSEGMLAVTTEVVVKLTPKPRLARCIMASFDDIRKAGDAVAAVIAAGIIPAGLEMMDKPMTAAVEDFVHAGYDLAAEAILLCESDSTSSMRAIAEMEKKYQLRCCNVFHAGDGNLHPLILFDANDPDQLRRCELFGADILETSVAMGGTVTGEHGVGVEKLSSMCVQFSPEEREAMFGVKRAFDETGLLNPGKVIPTLQRCAEYGRMHVKKGLLPFAHLERF
jgi:glycolate oxidase